MEEYLKVGVATDLTSKKDRRIYRALEILPGFLAWGTIGFVVLISFFAPFFAAVFIIAFDIYWLIKTVYLSIIMRSTFFKMRVYLQRDWRTELASVTPHAPQIKGITWNDFYHLVVLPMYHEPLSVVRDSFLGLKKSDYPLDKFIVVLALEARAGEKAQEVGQAIKEEFGNDFYKLIVTTHPADIPGELAGKGSNETWAMRQVKKDFLDQLSIPEERIIVSVFDIDTVVPEKFFACLTWHYLTAENPLRSSFQPIPLFINNIWEAPAFARVFAFSTTFWQMIQQGRPEQLVTFSSQSISYKALAEVGFWQTNVVSEDSRIFWQCLLHYDGDWRTIPLYFPVYMDANVAPSFLGTAKNQYKQIRRWLWGVENNPYFLFGFLKNKKIPRSQKWYFGFQMIEKAHSSSTNALIIFLLGWLPVWVGGQAFGITVLSYNLSHIANTVMGLAMVGLITSAIISIMVLPPRPPHYGKFKWVFMILQWLLFPINFIFFGAIPALDSQTRLMFGKYMGFWVTPKSRKNHS